MTSSGPLREPRVSDQRRAWLETVVELFAVAGDPKANRATLRLAAVFAKHAGHDGVCRTPRRRLMDAADIGRAYVFGRAVADLTDAGLVHRLNPGAPSRLGAEYALTLDGVRIQGGEPEDSPRLQTGWGFKVVSGLHRDPVESAPLAGDDDIWDEPRPYCEHTLRTCTPDCPEWGGR